MIASSGIGNTGGYGLLDLLVADSQVARSRVDTLIRQSSTGRVSDSYAGLGAAAATASRLQGALASNEAYQRAIDTAGGRMQVAQKTLDQISAVASTFYAKVNNLDGSDPGMVDSVAADARDALRQVAGLLDSKDGDTYVFAGQASDQAPVPDPDNITSSGFFTQIKSAVGQLAADGAPAVVAATMATAQSDTPGTTPFATALSAGSTARPAVQVGDGRREATGLLANANGDVASSGGSTTGSYMRDILRSLATLGSLSSGQATSSGFGALTADVRVSLGGAITALNQDAGVMGDRYTRLTATRQALSDATTTLKSQISGVEEVDMTKTLADLSAAQTQLQASYQLITGLNGLSLTKFLGSG